MKYIVHCIGARYIGTDIMSSTDICYRFNKRKYSCRNLFLILENISGVSYDELAQQVFNKCYEHDYYPHFLEMKNVTLYKPRVFYSSQIPTEDISIEI